MPSLGDMSVSFSADTSGLMSGLKSAKTAISSFASGGPLALVGAGLATAGAAAIGFGIASVKMAADFQTGLTTLITGAGESRKNIQMVGDGIKQMSVDTGTSTKQLVDGMYMIESAGFHGADGLNVLKAAAEGAKVGGADLGVVGNAVTTMLTDYHMAGNQATSATNALVATMGAGKMKMQDLSGSLAAVLPIASSLKISYPQVGAAIATMTNAGMPAQQATQNIANALRGLASPGGVATKALKSVGLSADDLNSALSKGGLTDALSLIEEHVGKKFPAGSVQATTALKQIMGGATGLNVALMLGGKNMEIFNNNVKTISQSMKAGGDAVQGWADVQNTLNFRLDQLKAVVNTAMITLGTAFLPVVTKVVGFFIDKVVPGIGGAIQFFKSVLNTIDFTDFKQGISSIGGEIEDIIIVLKKFGASLSPLMTDFAPFADFFGTVIEGVLGVASNAIYGLSGVLIYLDRTAQQGAGPIGFLEKVIKSFVNGYNSDNMVKGLKSIFETINKLSPLGNIFDALSRHAQDLGKWFQDSVIPALKQAEPGFASLMKAISGLLPVVIKIADVVHSVFQKAFDTLLPIFEKAIPIIIKLAGIIADGLGKAIQFLTPYVIQAIDAVGKFANVILSRVGPIVSQWFDKLSKGINDFQTIWNAIWPSVSAVLKGVWDQIVGVVQIAWAIVSGIIKIGLDILSGNWSQAWNDLKDMLSGIWDGIKTSVQGSVDTLVSIVTLGFVRMKKGASGDTQDMKDKADMNTLLMKAKVSENTFAMQTEALKHTQKMREDTIKQFQETKDPALKHSLALKIDHLGNMEQMQKGAISKSAEERDGVIKEVKKMKEDHDAHSKSLAQNSGNWFDNIKNTAISKTQEVVKSIGDRWKDGVKTVTGFFHDIWQGAVDNFNKLNEKIKGIITDAVKWLSQTWNNAVNTVVGWFEWLYKHNYYFKNLVDFIKSVISDVTKWLQDKWKDITTWISDKWNELCSNAQKLWSSISKAVQDGWNKAIGFVSDIWQKISTIFSNAWSKYIAGPIGQLWNNISSAFSNAWGAYISTPLGNLWNNISKWFSTIAGQAKTWGHNLIQGFVDGINGMVDSVGQAASNVTDKVAKFLGFHSPAKEGPGRDADKWAPNLVKMFAQGLIDYTPLVRQAINDMITSPVYGRALDSMTLSAKSTPLVAKGEAQYIQQQLVPESASLIKKQFDTISSMKIDRFKSDLKNGSAAYMADAQAMLASVKDSLDPTFKPKKGDIGYGVNSDKIWAQEQITNKGLLNTFNNLLSAKNVNSPSNSTNTYSGNNAKQNATLAGNLGDYSGKGLSQTIVVQVYLDGKEITKQLGPSIVSQMRLQGARI